MAYRILYKASVAKDLKRLDSGAARRVLRQVEASLSRNPKACPALAGEFAGLRRLRVGDYRVIYAIVDQDVIVLRIAHRREVYR